MARARGIRLIVPRVELKTSSAQGVFVSPPDFSTLTTCPATGVAVRHLATLAPEREGGYRGEFHLIGENTLHARVWGYTELHDAQRWTALLTRLIAQEFPQRAAFTFIEDYTNHLGASTSAKMFYLKFIQSHPGLRRYAFYGVSPFFQLVIKLALRMNPGQHFSVQIHNSYEDAICG
jgi:hypothetical protein